MYDVICIGGGLNYAAAVVLAKKLKVALIEKDLNHLGGTCLHEGCIPSKNLLHRTKAVFESSEDVFKKKSEIDLKKLQEKISSHIQKTTKAIINQCKIAGVELIEGEAFVVDEGVEVNDKILKAKHIIIGTGSKPRIPEGIEYDGKRIITSNEAIKFTTFPKEISIYGSGAIGLEMATFFAINGTKVNLIFRHEHISNKISPDIVENIEAQLQKIGVNLMPNLSINSAVVKNNKVVINDEMKTDYLLVATGRIANTEVVKTDKIKVTRAIEVNEYFETSMPGVYAIGDCNGKLNLAHSARAQALNVANQILGKKEKLNLNNIPKFFYTIPLSYAVVGKTTQKSSEFPLNHLGIASAISGSELGVAKIYVDDDNFISGAELFAPNAEELIGIIATAVTAEMDVELLEKVVFPHPTFSEEIDRAIRRIR
ncbi:dihydrolipoyl dehydrogenase family protein [Caminibacter sp.]